VLTGTILPSSDASRVDLQMRIAGQEVTRHIERTRIAAIVQGTDEVHQRVRQLEARRAALQADGSVTADQWWALTCDAHAAGEKALAEEWAWREVLGRDPDHADARASLGYVQVDNQWKTQGQLAMERGEVWHDGAWVQPEKRDEAIDAGRRSQAMESARFTARLAAQRQRAAEEQREDARYQAALASGSSGISSSSSSSSSSTCYRSWTYRPYSTWSGPVCYPAHRHHHHGWYPRVVWKITFTKPITLLIPLSSYSPGGPPYRPGGGNLILDPKR
jgi:hypothetical protein